MKRLLLLLLSVTLFAQVSAQIDLGDLKDKFDDVRNIGVKEALTERILRDRQEYDQESFNYAISFSDNAGLFEINERFEKSKYLFNQIRDKKLVDEEKNPIDQAADYNKTGEMLLASHKYFLAQLSFYAANELYKQNGYTNTSEHLLVESNLALSYHLSGRYSMATDLTNRVLKLRRENEPSSAAMGVSLNNKGVLLKDLGQYHAAEDTLNLAKELIGQTKGKKSNDYVIVLNNISQLHQVLGRYKKSEELLKQAMDIASSSMKEGSGNFIKLKINLALLYRDMERYDEAEEVYLTSMKAKKKRLGKNHPDYAHLAQGLASLFMDMGKEDEVEDLLLTAVNIYKKQFDENHPAYAKAISELGNFYISQKEYSKAKPRLVAAAAIRKNKLGENHPDYIKSQEDLAVLNWKQGKYQIALQLFDKVVHRSLYQIDTYFAPLSENEKAKFWKRVQPTLYKFYSFAADYPESSEILKALVFETHTKTKGLILQSYNQVKEAILSSGDQELIDKYNHWVDQNENLARLYTYTKEELVQENININEVEDEVNQLERELSKASNVFKDGYSKNKEQTIVQIQAYLKSDEALVDIIEYKSFENKFGNNFGYLYMLIKKSSSQLLSKADGGDMNGKFYKYYKNTITLKLDDDVSYASYWELIDKALDNVNTVYVVPDGIYTIVNLNTIKKPSGSFVIDDQTIINVNHNKDFVKLKKASGQVKIKSLLLVGNPEFDLGKSDKTRSGINKLPGTQTEIDNIAKQAKRYGVRVQKYSGNDATEDKVKHANVDVIHLATHGYFLEDISMSKDRVFGIETEKANDNPLHRSGLLLTGASKTLADEEVDHTSSDNGVLTAFEIKNQNYSNVKLAMLSACETGLGEIMIGEGVYGMQRAFQEAGVANLFMSLWKVDDQASMKMMTLIYTELFKGKEMSEAVRAAILTLKKEHPEPYFWGPFMLVRS